LQPRTIAQRERAAQALGHRRRRAVERNADLRADAALAALAIGRYSRACPLRLCNTLRKRWRKNAAESRSPSDEYK